MGLLINYRRHAAAVRHHSPGQSRKPRFQQGTNGSVLAPVCGRLAPALSAPYSFTSPSTATATNLFAAHP